MSLKKDIFISNYKRRKTLKYYNAIYSSMRCQILINFILRIMVSIMKIFQHVSHCPSTLLDSAFFMQECSGLPGLWEMCAHGFWDTFVTQALHICVPSGYYYKITTWTFVSHFDLAQTQLLCGLQTPIMFLLQTVL